MMWWHEARNWKWMVPGTLFFPALISWRLAAESVEMGGWGWGDWAIFPAGCAVVLFVAALVNIWAYVAEHWARTFADIRVAMNSTPEVRMFEAAKGMHPDAVKALLQHRRTIWRIKYVPKKDLVDWILDEAPSVHAGFLDYVLDNSNGSLMPKHGYLSEGSKKFDPEGLVSDYQQYEDLVKLLQVKLMVTQALGNQPPKFIPPWTQDLLRHRFGLDGESYNVDDDVADEMVAVSRAQAKAGIANGDTGKVPAVIQNALDGLQQTGQMKARWDASQK